jgi:hypothetical protein
VSGFKNEKEMWQYQKPRLDGKWDRYELITPSGHPDIKGSCRLRIYYIENKVGDYKTPKTRLDALRASQVKYFDWLTECGQSVYVCFGSTRRKEVTFYLYTRVALISPARPAFWLPY